MNQLSKIVITNNNELTLDNIIKITTFNSEEFILITTNGNITIIGKDLEMETLNTDTNKAIIKGVFHKITFGDEISKVKKDESFLKKLFK